MMLTETTAHTARHVVENMRAADREELFATMDSDDEEALMRDVCAWGPFNMTVWRDNPVAIFGASHIHKGVYRAFLLGTDEFPLIGLQVSRFIKHSLIPALENAGAHRCEALSLSTHVWAHRWLKMLGAVEEGRLCRFGRDRQDFIVFRWDRRECAAAKAVR